MLKMRVALTVLFLSITGISFAEEQPATNPEVGTSKDEYKPQNWYFHFGAGYAIPSYGTEANNALDSLKSLSGYKRTPIAIDLGAYWPQTPKSIAGVSIFGVSDSLAANGSKMQITQSVLAFSLMGFSGPQIGSDFFFRLDIGIGQNKIEVTLPNGSIPLSEQSKTNLAIQLGGGYALPLSKKTSIIGGVYYSKNDANNFTFLITCLL